MLTTGVVAAAARPVQDANPFRADAESLARGRAVYARNCASCHGPRGHGDGNAGRDLDPPPTDLAASDVAGQTDAQLFRRITRGRRPMPSFDRLLPEHDRWHVVNYLRALQSPAIQRNKS